MSFEEFTLLETYKIVLVLFRVGGIFLLSPFYSHRTIPFMVKLWFCFVVSILMMPVVSGLDIGLPGSFPELILIIFRELFVGILMGFVGLMLFIGVLQKGE